HVHFQIITDLLGLGCNYPGVALASRRAEFLSRSPDPNLMLRLPVESYPAPEPIKIVRGWRQYLYDSTGQAFLDLNAETALVGHSHPRVVEAVSRQLALLNTGTSLSHEYTERLLSKFPAALSKCYLVNSASEAMELAVRLARAHVRGKDAIVLEGADHGMTTTLINMSPLRFDGPGGAGRKHWVHVASRSDGREATGIVDAIESSGRGLAALVSDGLLPAGYLAQAYPRVRAAGGVCIASEVRTGFGRVGEAFWGFALHGVVPDIVVLGESMGNGFPLAGVVTTPEIAASFDNGMIFHSATGGNPVACAAGLAVLDILDDEQLPANAQQVGAKMLREIGGLQGAGLCLEARMENNRLREHGILAATRGDVVLIQPPLVFTEADADYFAQVLKESSET
ncbi:MAG: aminotransferase class III-fold pyridoxal phosphate-dependent enzyme, partial [Bryobacteraceae bacterium]